MPATRSLRRFNLPQLASPECSGEWTYTDRWFLSASAPLVLFVFVVIVGIFGRNWQKFVNTWLDLAGLIFVATATTALEPWMCTPQGEETYGFWWFWNLDRMTGTATLDASSGIRCADVHEIAACVGLRIGWTHGRTNGPQAAGLRPCSHLHLHQILLGLCSHHHVLDDFPVFAGN